MSDSSILSYALGESTTSSTHTVKPIAAPVFSKSPAPVIVVALAAAAASAGIQTTQMIITAAVSDPASMSAPLPGVRVFFQLSERSNIPPFPLIS